MVESSDRGERLAEVSIKRVLAVSIGLRRSEESVEEAVAINMLASGAVEVRIAVLGRAPAGDGVEMSPSGIPRIAARTDLRNVSNVR
jgi:hypothetical protein